VVVLAMMVHICADVVGKMIFASPIPGTLGYVASYYMVAVTFLPLAYVAHSGGHIRVEFFTENWPPRRIRRIDGVIALLGVGIVGWFALEAGKSAQFSMSVGEQTEIAGGYLDIWPSRWLLVIGGGALSLYWLAEAIDLFRGHTRRAPTKIEEI